MSDAGFIDRLCVYRIASVNDGAERLGGFRTGDEMATERKEVREHYRRRLEEELGKYGRSQSALARHLGINQSAVSRMVSGARNIKLEEQPAIEEYLVATDPNPPETGATRLPKDAEYAAEPLEAYPDLLEAVLTQRMVDPEEVNRLMDVDSDYPVVMTCAAMLEFELTAVVARLEKEGVAENPAQGNWYWEALVEKTEVAVAAERLQEAQAARMLAIFAIRDAFAHSRVLLSLLDDAVRPLTEQAIAYGYMRAADTASIGPDTETPEGRERRRKAVRIEFILTATAIAHQLILNDPAKTAAMFWELANKALDMPEAG